MRPHSCLLWFSVSVLGLRWQGSLLRHWSSLLGLGWICFRTGLFWGQLKCNSPPVLKDLDLGFRYFAHPFLASCLLSLSGLRILLRVPPHSSDWERWGLQGAVAQPRVQPKLGEPAWCTPDGGRQSQGLFKAAARDCGWMECAACFSTALAPGVPGRPGATLGQVPAGQESTEAETTAGRELEKDQKRGFKKGTC